MRVRSPRLVVLLKSQASSAARSRATARCLSHLQCPAPPRLRRLRAPLPPLQRRRPSSPRVHASPHRLPSASRGSSIHRPLSLPLPCWGCHPAPSPTLLIHTRSRSLALFHRHSTTRGRLATRCITRCTAASTTSGWCYLSTLGWVTADTHWIPWNNDKTYPESVF